MQVQHEARLLDHNQLSKPVGSQPSASNQSLELYCLTPQKTNALAPVDQLACGGATSGLLAAHVSQTNHIVIFDARTQQRRDRFPLKACDKKYSRQSFQVSAMDFAPDSQRLAIGQTDCIIYIYKLAQTNWPAGGVSSSGTVAGQQVSPVDLAVGPQKPATISGKFSSASPITCLIWSELGIMFGSQDGRVRLILSTSGAQQRPSNAGIHAQGANLAPVSDSHQSLQITAPSPKVIQLHNSTLIGSTPISLSYKSSLLLVGQLDCIIQVLVLGSEQPAVQQELAQDLGSLSLSVAGVSRRNSSIQSVPSVRQTFSIAHSCPPLHLGWLPGNTIFCAGSDGRVAFHLVQLQQERNSYAASPLQVIDLKEDIKSADYSPINEVLALITRNRLLFIKWDQESGSWRAQPALIEFKNLFSLTSLRWLRDGAQLALGSTNCSLDLFKCSWQKEAINEQLDICHIARNRIRITDRERNLLATYKTQHDIKRVNIIDQNQSVLIWTAHSLLLARLNCAAHSEIKWPLSSAPKSTRGKQKFLFEASGYVLVYNEPTSECHLIKLGENCLQFSTKLSRLKRARLSIRQFPPLSELCRPNHLGGAGGSSPSRPKSSSSSLVVRVSSASQCQRSSLTNELAPDSSLLSNGADQAGVAARSQLVASQSERFAYVSGDHFNLLTVLDLKQSNEPIYAHNFEQSIERLKFSFTSRYLILLLNMGAHADAHRLLLLEINSHPAGVRSMSSSSSSSSSPSSPLSRVELVLTLESCHFADWLWETDSLVAQVKHEIQIRHDLDEIKRVRRLDCRTLNYRRLVPLIDLSGAPSGIAPSYPKIERLDCQNSSQTQDHVIMSNGWRVPLDRVKRQFYRELALAKLESAFELLQRQAAEQQQASSWLLSKLGWMAVERNDCQLAVKVFTRLRHSSLVAYLENCLSLQKVGRAEESAAKLSEDEEELEEFAQAGEEHEQERRARNESALMLAKLCGNWAKFEELAPSQEVVLATYKRLNKWSRCLDYLARTQQFRQRDIAELERQKWLINEGRLREAARFHLDHSGDLVGALSLLIDRDQFEEACDLLLDEQKTPLVSQWTEAPGQTERKLLELANSVNERLLSVGDLRRAARLNAEILSKPREGLELFAKAGRFEEALELAQTMLEDLEWERIRALHLEYARHLEQQFRRNLIGKRKMVRALDHLIEARQQLEAVELALDLGLLERAQTILHDHRQPLNELKLATSHQETQLGALLARFRAVGDSFLNNQLEGGERTLGAAIEAFELAEELEKVVELLVELGDVKRAFQVSLSKLNDRDETKTQTQFVELAQKLEAAAAAGAKEPKKLERAERIYLELGRPELAIEMYKRLELNDKMLALIETHQADQLEASLLQLARSLESSGRLEEAESYLIRASPAEWTNVVRMYRLAQRWPDAFRVARANCLSDEDPLLIQLAYWWAKWLVTRDTGPGSLEDRIGEARKLLDGLGLTKQVVEFCCETKNHQFAMDLLRHHHHDDDNKHSEQAPQLTGLKRDVALRYANQLERQHKLAEAERVLVENQLIEQAARMHLDNDQPQEAIRVIEQQLSSSNGAEPSEKQTPDRRAKLADLLNETLVACGQRLAAEISSSFSRTAPIMRDSSAPAKVAQMSPEAAATSSSALRLNSAKIQLAQQMFLRAQRPELAIEMYQSLGMWQEAIQVAQRFAPRLLEQVERALDAQVNQDIEPILRSRELQLEAHDEGAHQAARFDAEATMVRANGRQEETLSELDRLRQQLARQARDNDRKAARVSLASYLDSLKSSLEHGHEHGREHDDHDDDNNDDDELARHLDQLAGLAANWPRPIASLLGEEENALKVCQLADQIALALGWHSSVWRSLRNLLACCFRAIGPHGGELGAVLRVRLTVAHFVANYRVFEFCLQEALSAESAQLRRLNPAAGGLNMAAQPAATPAPARAGGGGGGGLFARKARRAAAAPQSVADQSSSGRRAGQWSPAVEGARAMTVKQVEKLLQPVGHGKGANSARTRHMLVDLLAKLSLGLLRHTDLLEAKRALLAAGRWQLALGRRKLAHDLWAASVELASALGETGAPRKRQQWPNSLASRVAKLVELPKSFVLDADFGADKASQQQQMADVRHWLLESLISGQHQEAPLASEPEAELPVGWAKLGSKPACLVCALACERHSSLRLEGGIFGLRHQELGQLLQLAGLAGDDEKVAHLDRLARLVREKKQTTLEEPSGPLHELLEFIINLAGSSPA